MSVRYDEEYATLLFPNFDESTKKALFYLESAITNFARTTDSYNVVIAVVSTFINCFHILVLCQNSMRMSVINACLIGASLSYFVYTLTLLETRVIQMEGPRPECRSPLSLLAERIQNVIYMTHNFSRRCSTWLGILMAAIRLIVVKSSTDSKFQTIGEPKRVPQLIILVLILSLPLSIFYFLGYELREFDPWTPAETCLEFPRNYSQPHYGLVVTALFSMNGSIINKIYFYADGAFSKVLPGLLSPILTILLIKELRAIKRKIRRSGTTMSCNRTTRLVTYMTVCHLSSNFPAGILVLIKAQLVSVPGFLSITANFNSIFVTIYLLNSIVQCLICFALSQNYRSTVRDIAGKVKDKVYPTASDHMHSSQFG